MSEVAIFWNPTRPAKTAGGVLFGDGDQYKITDAGTSGHPLLSAGSGDPAFGQLNLAGAGITGDLPYANLAQGSALSVLGVTGNATADNASIAAGTDNQVLRRSGTTVAFGAVNLASSDAITGDLPFANLTQGSALSVLGVTGNSTADNASIAAGTDHQVLRRSGTALAFGAVNLAQSAAVTGTLPVGNGGTGTATTFTEGSVVYAGASGIYSQDNAGLFWDASNNFLGIGTATPSAHLELSFSTDTNSFFATKYFDSGAGPAFFFRKSRGSAGTPAAVDSGDSLGAIVFRGRHDSGDFGGTVARGPNCLAAEDFTSSAQGTALLYDTTPIGSTTPATRLLVSSAGNVGIGPTTNAGTNPTAGSMTLVFGDGTAPSGMPSNTCGVYGDDVAGTVEVFVIDEGGAAAQISPHNFTLFTPDLEDPYPWSYFSENVYLGERVNVDIGKLARLVENLTGEKLIYREQFPKRSWEDDQLHHIRAAIAAHEAWKQSGSTADVPEPPAPVYRNPPPYVRARVVADSQKEAQAREEIRVWETNRSLERVR